MVKAHGAPVSATTVKTLEGALEVFQQGKWAQGDLYELDEEGKASSVCLQGAVYAVTGNLSVETAFRHRRTRSTNLFPALRYLNQVAIDTRGRTTADFNDSESTTRVKAMNLLRRAIKDAKEALGVST